MPQKIDSRPAKNRHTLFGQPLIGHMLSFSDTLAVLGALGLGAMLDVIVKSPHKKSVSDWLSGLVSRAGSVSYGGSKFLDKVFGRSVLSWRAAPRYAAISIISISISYAFAVLSSPPTVLKDIFVFTDNITSLDIAVLGVCFLAAVVGDNFSYAQTRLFVRAIDRSKSAVVSAGLVAADLIVSLSIFFAAFSVARLICVLLLLQFHPPQVLTHTETYAPAYLAKALAAADVEVRSEAEVVTAFAIAVANGRTPSQLGQIAEWQERGVMSALRDPASLRHVDFSAQRHCIGQTADERSAAGAAVVRTQELFTAVMAEQSRRRPIVADPEKISAGMSTDYYTTSAAVRRDPNLSCPFEITMIRASMTTRAFVSAAGPFNAFAAATERTLFDAYQVVAFKLAPYVGFDPYSSMPMYFASLTTQLQQTLLGAFPVDPDRATLATYFNDPIIKPTGQVNVPFSPMVASALTTSAFLIIYLSTVTLAVFRGHIASLVQRLLPAIDLEKSVFTSISVALALLFVATSGMIWGLQAMWRLMVGS